MDKTSILLEVETDSLVEAVYEHVELYRVLRRYRIDDIARAVFLALPLHSVKTLLAEIEAEINEANENQ